MLRIILFGLLVKIYWAATCPESIFVLNGELVSDNCEIYLNRDLNFFKNISIVHSVVHLTANFDVISSSNNSELLYPNLEYFEFSYNEVYSVNGHASVILWRTLCKLNRLSKLNLKGNRNSFFLENSFDKLQCVNLMLRDLDVSDNGLRYVAGQFPMVQNLTLNRNRLLTLPLTFQHDFPELRNLDLSENEFTAFGGFWLPDTIKFLNASYNAIETIENEDGQIPVSSDFRFNKLSCLCFDSNLYSIIALRHVQCVNFMNFNVLDTLKINCCNPISITKDLPIPSLPRSMCRTHQALIADDPLVNSAMILKRINVFIIFIIFMI